MKNNINKKIVVCPICGESVLTVKGCECLLRNRITIFRGYNAFAKCKHCGHEVKVPIALTS